MGDIADQAEAAESFILAANINAAKGKPLDTSNPSGECLFCGESTGLERRWCDTVCRNDWEREQ
jgi:hypothetical protein